VIRCEFELDLANIDDLNVPKLLGKELSRNRRFRVEKRRRKVEVYLGRGLGRRPSHSAQLGL